MSPQSVYHTTTHAARAPLHITIPSTTSDYPNEKHALHPFAVHPSQPGDRPCSCATLSEDEDEELEFEEADERDFALARSMDRLCIIAVLIVDMVLFAEVLGPWPRSAVVTLYYPSGIFLELCSVLCWVAARAGADVYEPRAALSVWAMGGLASLFLIEAYFHAPPALLPSPDTPEHIIWCAYVGILSAIFAAGVCIIARSVVRRCPRVGGIRLGDDYEGPEMI